MEAGDVTYAEELAEKGKELSIKDLKACFQKVDANGDNVINFAEFCMAIEELGVEWELHVAKAAFKKMDENKNKEIDWYEFTHGIHIVNPNVSAFWHNIFSTEEERKKAVEDMNEIVSMETVYQVLADSKSKWTTRNKCLRSFYHHLQNVNESEFHEIFTKITDSYCCQLEERQSVVVKEACEQLSKIAEERKIWLLPHLVRLYPSLYAAIRMKINVINEAGIACGFDLVRNVPDNDENLLLTTLSKGTDTRHDKVRAACYEYIKVIIESATGKEKLKNEESYAELLKITLVKGCSDKGAAARQNCFKAIILLKSKEVGLTDLYQNIFDSCSKQQKRSIERADPSAKKKRAKRKRPRFNRNKFMKKKNEE